MKQNIHEKLDTLVKSITKSYEQFPKISHIDCENLPNKEEIVFIIVQLRELFFPGYFSKQPMNKTNIESLIGEKILNIYNRLSKQIYRSLKFQNNECDNKQHLRDEADKLTVAFIKKIPKIRELLNFDVEAAYDGDPAAFSTDEIIFSYPGVVAITIYRIAHELYNANILLIPRMMSEYAHNLTGIDIHPGAKIGKYFFIDHGTGTVIGETSVIGDGVKIYQGVTLGALSLRGGQSLKGTKRHPTLKKNVTVYAGASILGGDTVVGEGVTIGGNVFLTKSVSEKTKVSLKSIELECKDDKI